MENIIYHASILQEIDYLSINVPLINICKDKKHNNLHYVVTLNGNLQSFIKTLSLESELVVRLVYSSLLVINLAKQKD